MSGADPGLERFPPQLLFHLLTATRRFDPGVYAYLCRRYHLDADRILGLFGKVEAVGAGQISDILADLRTHMSYGDILFLAGRNAFLTAAEDAKATASGGGAVRFPQLLKQLFPPFLGTASHHVMAKGTVQFVEVFNSIFARGAALARPVCGFYCGFMSECGKLCTEGRCAVAEIQCAATEPDGRKCLFQVAL